jgi:hypothetical protein
MIRKIERICIGDVVVVDHYATNKMYIPLYHNNLNIGVISIFLMLTLLPTFYKNTDLRIETDFGYEPFFGIQKIYRKKYIHLTFENGKELICSLNHPINTTEGIVIAKDLNKNTEVVGKQENTFLKRRKTIRKKIELYDIVNAGINHRYYSNDILSNNCSFLGSSSTLIKTEKLTNIPYIEPIETNEYLKIYEKPDPKRRYMATVDTAEGVERDFSTVVVIDITEIPYKVVATYKNNLIAPIIFPNVIAKLGKEYNNAFVLVELNAMGSQVADILFYDLEYTNLLMCAVVGRSGLVLGQGFSGKCKLGLQITKNTKRVGCSNLKSLIEDDQLIVNDFGIVTELGTYVAKNDTYAADDGNNDDLIACLVVFSWCVSQPYFKELTDLDTTKSITEVHRQEIQEEMELFGVLLINGVENQDETFTCEDGILWSTSDQVEDELYEYGYSAGGLLEFF